MDKTILRKLFNETKGPLQILGYLEFIQNYLKPEGPHFGFVLVLLRPYSFSTYANSCFILKALSYLAKVYLALSETFIRSKGTLPLSLRIST